MNKIIVALDFNNKSEALALAKQLDSNNCRLKIGKTMFTKFGPDLVKQLQDLGFDIFLDLKFHDIPMQVAGACAVAAELGVWMLSLHIAGGENMITTTRQQLQQFKNPPLLVGITLLTSLDQTDLNNLHINLNPQQFVLHMAQNGKKWGLDGVVCSPLEVAAVRETCGSSFNIVTPGIRMQQGGDDQKRTMTPTQAIAAGSDFLVIGRPITQAPDPIAAVADILAVL